MPCAASPCTAELPVRERPGRPNLRSDIIRWLKYFVAKTVAAEVNRKTLGAKEDALMGQLVRALTVRTD
jgi:hypothetical protein